MDEEKILPAEQHPLPQDIWYMRADTLTPLAASLVEKIREESLKQHKETMEILKEHVEGQGRAEKWSNKLTVYTGRAIFYIKYIAEPIMKLSSFFGTDPKTTVTGLIKNTVLVLGLFVALPPETVNVTTTAVLGLWAAFDLLQSWWMKDKQPPQSPATTATPVS